MNLENEDMDYHEIFSEMMRYAKKLPFGYRDVEYEEMLLRNTFKDEIKKESKIENARAMLEENINVELISRVTKLPVKEIKMLKKNTMVEIVNKE